MHGIENRRYGICVFSVLVSLLFGLAYYLSSRLAPSGSNVYDYYRLIQGPLFFCAALTIVVYAVKWYWNGKPSRPFSCDDRILFLCCFLLIIASGLFWLLVYYPGVGMYDTLAILTDSNFNYAKQHPWFYIWCVKCIVKVTAAFGGDYETALVAESVLQIIISGLVCAHCVVWLNRKNIGRVPLLLIMGFYIFDPMISLYRIAIFKDVPHAYMLVEWVLLLYDMWESEGESLRKWQTIVRLGFCIVLSLLRSNGIYISAFLLVCMLLCFRKRWRQTLILVGLLILTIFGNSVFEKTHSIDHLFKETVGIPLQQIAATVTYGGEMTDDQIEFVDKVIPVDFIIEKYDPYTADKLKWGGAPIDNAFLNAHKAEFLKVWAQMMIPNLKIYVTAHLKNTFGFWSTNNARYSYYYSTIYVSSFDDWIVENDIDIQDIFPERSQDILMNLTDSAVNPVSEGQMFWVFVLLMLALTVFKGWKIWIVGAPAMGVWLTLMVSTPVAYQWRYMLFFALTLPLLAGILLLREDPALPEHSKEDHDS